MKRIVTIDGKEYCCVANGATPRKYRSLFTGKDIFTDISNAVSATGEILNSEVFENLAFCMAMQGGSIPQDTKIDDWLSEMESPLSIMESASDILELWNAETTTTSVGKKG